MVAYPQFFDSTDTTLQTAAIAVSQDSGTTYGATTFHLWNDHGGSLGGSTLKNCRIVPKVFSGVSRVASGFPILDEAWVQIQVSGLNNAGDSTMEAQTTGFVPVGPNNPLVLKDIPRNCARFLDVKIVVPAGAGNLSQTVYLELVFDEATVVLPFRLGAALGGPGILPDWMDATLRRLRWGRKLSASGAQTVSISEGSWVYDGVPYATIQRNSPTLNQNDVNGNALTAGESYIAVLYQPAPGGGFGSITKGVKAVSPTKPALPAGVILLGYITVHYQAGGTSIINSGDLDTSGVIYGEYLGYKASGLNYRIAPGVGITNNDFQPFAGSPNTVALTDNSSINQTFLMPDGSIVVTQDATAALPTPGAIYLEGLFTAGGVVTAEFDQRPFTGKAITESQVILSLYGPPTVNVTSSIALLTEDAYLESVDFELGSLGVGGASGVFKVDVLYWLAGIDTANAPNSIYPNSATQDLRPTIAYNATFLRSTNNRGHEINLFGGNGPKGTRFALKIIAVPSGTFSVDPEDVFVILPTIDARAISIDAPQLRKTILR